MDPAVVLAGHPHRVAAVRPAMLMMIRAAAHNLVIAEERNRNPDIQGEEIA
jgi:hypothetical protein